MLSLSRFFPSTFIVFVLSIFFWAYSLLQMGIIHLFGSCMAIILISLSELCKSLQTAILVQTSTIQVLGQEHQHKSLINLNLDII